MGALSGVTDGKWGFCCDSYGKVRHSKKACIGTTVVAEDGAEQLVTVAARISNWQDAQVMCAAKEMLTALEGMNHMGGDERGGYCICPLNDGSAPHSEHATCCQDARYAVAKARNLTDAHGDLLPNAFARVSW